MESVSCGRRALDLSSREGIPSGKATTQGAEAVTYLAMASGTLIIILKR